MSDESSGVFGSRGAPVDTVVAEASGHSSSSSSQPARVLDPEKEQSPRHPGNTESPQRPGTSRHMEQLVRPAPAGRKATRKARNVDERERGGFACSRSSREERSVAGKSGEGAERVTESERDMQRQGGEDRMGRAEQSSVTRGRERSDGRHTGLTSSRTGSAPSSSSRPAPGSASTSTLQRPPLARSRTAAPLPPPPPPPPPLLLLLQRSPQRTALGTVDLRHRASSRDSDPPWRLEVRLRSRRPGAGQTPPRQSQARRTHLPSGGSPASGEGEEADEEGGHRVTEERGERQEEGVEGGEAVSGGNGALHVIRHAPTSSSSSSSSSSSAVAATADRMRSKREKNRLRSQRRRQRRREIRKQSRQQDSRTV